MRSVVNGEAFATDFARRIGRQRLVVSAAAVTWWQTSGPIAPDGRTVKAERGARDSMKGRRRHREGVRGRVSLPRMGV